MFAAQQYLVFRPLAQGQSSQAPAVDFGASCSDGITEYVRFVKRAQQLGFSLEEIDTLLDLASGGPDSCSAAKSLATEKLAQLDEKMAHLGAMRDSLGQLVATCEKARDQRLCPLLDAVE